jgi:hypothetical protein
MTDYMAELDRLLEGVDLDLEPHEEASAQVTDLARQRARTGEPE